MSANYRTVWISDVHLGTLACRANELLSFLEEVSAERIYLVGDIIDLEQMRSRTSFTDTHMQVIKRLIDLNDKDCEVVYVPGNHDVEFRGMLNRRVFDIPVVENAIHETVNGDRYLVIHGDEFDDELRDGSYLQRFGSFAYETIMGFDVMVNTVRRSLRQAHWPLSATIKGRLTMVNDFIERFESIAAQFAAERGFDGVICGHIHKPTIRTIGQVTYANDGDWVEHSSALAETYEGAIKLLNWQSNSIQVSSLPKPSPIAA